MIVFGSRTYTFEISGRRLRTRSYLIGVLLSSMLIVGRQDANGQGTCTATSATANTCAVSFSSPMTVGKTTRLEVSAVGLTLANSNLSATDYVAGFKTAGSLALTARANSAVSVTIAAANANFQYAGSASPAPSKAASTLQWSINSGASWASLSTSTATILTTSGATSGSSVNPSQPATGITFRTNLGWTTDPPGTYTLPINFTITAP